MSKVVASRKSEFIGAPLETVHFENKYFGVPRDHRRGLPVLQRREDQVGPARPGRTSTSRPPSKAASSTRARAYEGLTCDYLELLFAAGGQVLNADGTKSAINSPQATKALAAHGRRHQGRRRAEGRHDLHGARVAGRVESRQVPRSCATGRTPTPRAATTRARRSRASSRSPRSRASRARGKAGVLGGHNSVISVYSKNPGAALAVVNYVTGPRADVRNAASSRSRPCSPRRTTTPAGQEGAAVLRRAQAGRRAGRTRAPSRRSIRRSRRPSTTTSTTRSPAGTAPADAVKKVQSTIDKALSTF